MGNTQGRKRAAADEVTGYPARKRIRLVDNGRRLNSPESLCGGKRNPVSRLLAFSTSRLHLTDNEGPSSPHEYQTLQRDPRDRCRSLDGTDAKQQQIQYEIPDNSNPQNVASCSALNRTKDYPTSWLEALFLPEFPTKSLVSENSFMIANELGSGAFGRVYRATAVHDMRSVYAIKIQEKRKIIMKDSIQQVKREASLQRLMKPHTFIARLYATWQTRTKLYSVFQYPIGSLGDLFAVWREYGNFDERTVRIFSAEMACALDFIHRSNIIYRDLKLENVILDCDGHVRIIDFGLAKRLKDGETTTTICGTLQYMSPDVASMRPYAHFVDWWSLAVVMHVLFTGYYPYPNADAKHHNDLKFIDYSTPYGASEEFGNLMDRQLAVPIERRLCSFAVFHAHPFFHRLDFAKVEQKVYSPIATIRGLGIPILAEKEEDELSIIDGEENWTKFEERYDQFRNFDYFASESI